MKRLVVVLLAAVLSSTPAFPRQRAVGVRSNSYIDAEIFAKLARDGIAAAPLAGDEEFLRRVTVDLTGTIPTADDVTAFLADTAPDKRARKIDALLASPAFTDRWTLWFGDLVQNVQVATNSREYYLGRNAYYTWIKDSISSNKPYDQMVREVLTGEGNSFQSGVANYVVRQLQPNGPIQDTYDNLAAHSAEKFLGIPMLCISCHDGFAHLELVNSYLREKKRYDFWRMAAFFAKTSARGERYNDPANPNANPVVFTVSTEPNRQYRLNTTDGNKSPRQPAQGQSNVVTPAFILTGEEPRQGEPYRAAYARMLTADRQFARNAVNLLWREMFGRGLVEPVNAFDLSKLTTQPSHPALLEALASDFIAKNYNLREMLRTITLSNAYQLSSKYTGTQPAESYFARRQPRRMQAEVLLDSVATSTNVPFQFIVQGLGLLTKAVQLPDTTEARRAPAGTLMGEFGRGNRDDIARSNDSAIAQALSLMNDPIITTRVKRANNSTVQKTLSATSDPATIVDRLYLATLSRHPTENEKKIAVDYLKGGPLVQRAEDLQFVLINSLEFLFV